MNSVKTAVKGAFQFSANHRPPIGGVMFLHQSAQAPHAPERRQEWRSVAYMRLWQAVRPSTLHGKENMVNAQFNLEYL